jgi:hypothetical protein
LEKNKLGYSATPAIERVGFNCRMKKRYFEWHKTPNSAKMGFFDKILVIDRFSQST